MAEKRYTPLEVAAKVLQKTEELTKSAIAGLKSTKLTPVEGVISPIQTNTATPTKVGSQAVVKIPKSKKMGQATDKPSVFFKSEEFHGVKKPSIENLRAFLEKQRSKR
jgi:hypothetical protein